jgi:hypothetical protein
MYQLTHEYAPWPPIGCYGLTGTISQYQEYDHPSPSYCDGFIVTIQRSISIFYVTAAVVAGLKRILRG